MDTRAIMDLAKAHALELNDDLDFNEMGIDFKVAFATAHDGTKWVLRMARRDDLIEQIETERRILNLVGKYLSVAVPEWKIVDSIFIAYPRLENEPVLIFNSETQQVIWHMDLASPDFVPSLAKVLVQLHQIPVHEAVSAGLKVLTPEAVRQELWDKVRIVKNDLGISSALETRWRKWLDNDRLWPDFTTFIHGDLYAGHILATKNGTVSGIIDWSEAQVSDPSTDFSGHYSVFGEESLKQLIEEYERLGGKVWDKIFEQSVERHAAGPLSYGYFAIGTEDNVHIEAAKAQLGLA